MNSDYLDMDLSATDDLEVDISLSDGFELSDVVSQTFGVDQVSDLQLSDEPDNLELEDEDTSDSNIELSDSILIRASDSVVDTMAAYAAGVRDALAVYRGRANKGSTLPRFVIPYGEFNYMPEDVFKIFCEITIDLASDVINVGAVEEAVAERSIKMLFDATHWSPELVRPEYVSGFLKYYKRIQRASSTGSTVDKSDITSLMDHDAMVKALWVFEVNTRSFETINNFFNDSASMASTNLVDDAPLGVFIEDYMERKQLRALSIHDVYFAVGEYLSGHDSMEALHLSQDEVLEYSTGELLRRTLLYELNSGVLYPGALRGVPLNNTQGIGAIVVFLLDAIKAGSIAASMLFAIGSSMNALKEWDDSVEGFLLGLLGYFQAFLEDSALVNPVYFGQVKQADEGFILSYAVGDRTYDIKSSGLLCDVLGDKSGTRCIPGILVDEKNGYTICPPPTLYKPLHGLSRGGRTKVSGMMCYRFTPTVSWLASNQILVQNDEETAVSSDSSIQSNASALLQTLLSYDNSFDSDGTVVAPVVVKCSDYIYYAMSSGVDEEALKLSIVVDAQSSSVCAHDGTLYVDPDTRALVTVFTTTDGALVERTYDSASYTEEYLQSHVDVNDSSFSLSDFVIPAKSAKPLDITVYCSAVKKLCEVTALDYQEELQLAMTTVSREFFYAVGVPSIDSLVASRLLRVYQKYMQSREASGEVQLIDSFNLPSVKELIDIIVGKPNEASGYEQWCPELKGVINNTTLLSVDDVCANLDRVDFDLLALWMLNPSELRRSDNSAMLRALHAIPEIGSRLLLLENKLIVMKVMQLIGSTCCSVFSRHSFLTRAYNTPIDEDSITYISSVLLTRSKKKNLEFALPLCRKVLGSHLDPEAGSFKYYVLERNLHGLLTELQVGGEKYEKDTEAFMSNLPLSSDTVFTELTSADFNRLVDKDAVVKCCSAMHWRLLELLYDGLINEAFVNDGFQVIKAYDLFNSFYDLVLSGGRVEFDDYSEDFLTYAGSLVISYAPIVGASADEIDGGTTDRFMAFVKAPEDFEYDTDISYLREKSLEDVRVFHDEGEG